MQCQYPVRNPIPPPQYEITKNSTLLTTQVDLSLTFIFAGEVHGLEEHQEEAKYIILSYYSSGISNHVSHYCGSCNLSAFGCAFIYLCYIST